MGSNRAPLPRLGPLPGLGELPSSINPKKALLPPIGQVTAKVPDNASKTLRPIYPDERMVQSQSSSQLEALPQERAKPDSARSLDSGSGELDASTRRSRRRSKDSSRKDAKQASSTAQQSSAQPIQNPCDSISSQTNDVLQAPPPPPPLSPSVAPLRYSAGEIVPGHPDEGSIPIMPSPSTIQAVHSPPLDPYATISNPEAVYNPPKPGWSFLGCCSCFGFGKSRRVHPTAPPIQHIRVATWNVKRFNNLAPGPELDSLLAAVAQTILSSGVDILAVQELPDGASLQRLVDITNASAGRHLFNFSISSSPINSGLPRSSRPQALAISSPSVTGSSSRKGSPLRPKSSAQSSSSSVSSSSSKQVATSAGSSTAVFVPDFLGYIFKKQYTPGNFYTFDERDYERLVGWRPDGRRKVFVTSPYYAQFMDGDLRITLTSVNLTEGESNAADVALLYDAVKGITSQNPNALDGILVLLGSTGASSDDPAYDNLINQGWQSALPGAVRSVKNGLEQLDNIWVWTAELDDLQKLTGNHTVQPETPMERLMIWVDIRLKGKSALGQHGHYKRCHRQSKKDDTVAASPFKPPVMYYNDA